MKIGFSVNGNTGDELINNLSYLADISTECVELGFTRAERIPTQISPRFINEVEKFKHISIHAPVKKGGDWIRYPSEIGDKILDQLQEMISLLNIKYVLFHPDLIDDFDILNQRFGDKLAFENMDSKKEYGTSIRDLKSVFKKSPQANWVCDVNHIYTIDPTMQLAQAFHAVFSDRLAYYHISAHGGFHDSYLSNPHEKVILNGVLNTTLPMIHEGMQEDFRNLIHKERDLVREYLNNRLDSSTLAHGART